MPGQCCVPRCNNKGGHVFPKDDSTRAKWIQAVKRGERNWSPSRWSIVCGMHFEEADYIVTRKEGSYYSFIRLCY